MMISETIIFWTYLVLHILCALCSLFVLYYLLFDRNLRQALHNHVIIILLIIGLLQQVTITPWMLYFYSHNREWDRSEIFCRIWSYIDWSLYIIQTFLFAWGTVEKHILIFHHQWTTTTKQRFFLHYLPLIVILLYGLIFYLIVFFFPFCENDYDSSYMICLYPCSLLDYWLGIWETMVHQLFPLSIIVLWQKYRRHQIIRWGRYRKMILQLFSISLLYLTFSFPLALIYTFNYFDVSEYFTDDIFLYAEFFSFLTYFLFPLISLLSLPEIPTKVQGILRCSRRTTAVHLIPNTLIVMENDLSDRSFSHFQLFLLHTSTD